MAHTVCGECFSMNKSTSYLSLCLSLDSFCDETSRTWVRPWKKTEEYTQYTCEPLGDLRYLWRATSECHSNEHPQNLVSGDEISQDSSKEPTQLGRDCTPKQTGDRSSDPSIRRDLSHPSHVNLKLTDAPTSPCSAILMMLMIVPCTVNCLTCFFSSRVNQLQHAVPVQQRYKTTAHHGKYPTPLDGKSPGK